jgi:high affinity sulfate transporter 1
MSGDSSGGRVERIVAASAARQIQAVAFALGKTGVQKTTKRFPLDMPRIQLFEGVRGVAKASLAKEAMGGVTLAALMVPLNIGYAQVAGLPPIVGLYTAIVPMIIFAIFTSSRQLVAGPDAPIAALIGSLLGAMAAPSDPHYIQLAYAQALMVAVVFGAFWIFKLGFLANFLSRAVMAGFVTGLGIEVFSSQLKKIMGVSVEADGWFREMWELIKAIPDSNGWTLTIGIGTIVVIRLMKRFTPGIPGALAALVIATIIVDAFNLDKHGVTILGDVPSGLPSLTYPHGVSWGEYLNLLGGALAIAGVTLADALLVGRSYAQKRGYPLDANRELFAFGAANVASGFTGGFSIGSSASRTAAMDGTGSRSQIPSLLGAAVVALVVLFFTDTLALLPNAALGGIVANAVLALIEVDTIRDLYRVRRDEALVAITCALGVLVLGSLKAVILAFLLSTIMLVRRSSEATTDVLGTIGDQPGLYSTRHHPDAVTTPGLVMYRFADPIYFANALTFLTEASKLIETSKPQVEWFVLDAEAISDIDATGADTLGQVLDLAEKHDITFAVSRLEADVEAELIQYDLFDRIGGSHLYHTNWDALQAFLARGDQNATAPQPEDTGVPRGGTS